MKRAPLAFVTITLVVAALAAHAAVVRSAERAAAPATTPTFSLGYYDFEATDGGGDPQGWTSFDATASPEAYFHVDDFAGPGSPYAPLSGTQSLWCGVYCGSGIGCAYAAPPGYGNNWLQDFTSGSFPVLPGNITFSFSVSYDLENGYDFVRAQYRSKTGRWNTLGEYTGTGSASPSLAIPGDSLDGSVQVRFQVETDGAFSDEDGNYDSDGAAVIDDILLSGPGIVYIQDFEAEAVGDTATTDGHWGAQRTPGFGDFAGLFDGDTVVQEDMSYTNTSYLWGFFNGSPDDYTCGGYPGQAVVPFPTGDNAEDYIDNEIHSPLLAIPYASPDTIAVEFDVYADMPIVNAMFYRVRARFEVDSVLGPWKTLGSIYATPSIDWFRQRETIAVPPGATSVQVALGVADRCRTLCPPYSGTCHSHGPLFDNVAIDVITSGNTPPGSNVEVYLPGLDAQPVTATFDSVITGGETTLQYSAECAELPPEYVAGDTVGCFFIETSASYSGDVTICVQYEQSGVQQPENALRLLHGDEFHQWHDITSSIDTTGNILCGATTSLSPFVVARFDPFTGAGDNPAPARLTLRQNVPNPFNPATSIGYDVPAGGADVSIRVYDVAGRLVRTLVDGEVAAGARRVTWDGTDRRGNAVSSGVYFYRMTSGTFTQTRKMVILK